MVYLDEIWSSSEIDEKESKLMKAFIEKLITKTKTVCYAKCVLGGHTTYFALELRNVNHITRHTSLSIGTTHSTLIGQFLV